MREDLLHYIWKFKKYHTKNLSTTEGSTLQILNFGKHNKYSGPDFLHARIEIDGQIWVGNVEIHLNSSDWFSHGHHKDEAYHNVILHVVWNHDREVPGPSGSPLTTLLLSEYVDQSLIENFKKLFQKNKRTFINCEDYSRDLSIFLVLPWYEHLYRERLDEKTKILRKHLAESRGDWEQSFFIWMLQGFGQHVNKPSFLSLARAIDFKLFRRLASDVHQLESLLFGMSGLLQNENSLDHYQQSLVKSYRFIRNKNKLVDKSIIRPEFMGVRPPNFPTIRLSQFAALYASHKNLLSKMIESNCLGSMNALLQVQASPYWDSHYTFGKIVETRIKKLSRSFSQTLIINSILPAKYLFAKEHGEDNYQLIRSIIAQLRTEQNGVIDRFRERDFPVHHALDSQALLQLHNSYCVKNRCLECAIGNQILN